MGMNNPGKPGLAAIELNVTFACNLSCAYCFVHEKKPDDRMSTRTARHGVDLLLEHAAFPLVNITLIGGEPLLEYNLIKEIVPYTLTEAKKRGVGVNWAITTNGTLINEEMLAFFAQHKIYLLLSLDGGPASHDRYRKTKNGVGTWQKISRIIPLLKKYQNWLGVRMTVNREAIEDMRQDFNRIVDLGVNQFIIAPAQGSDPWPQTEITRYGLNLLKILQDYRQLKQRGIPIFIEEFEKSGYEYEGWGCRAGRTSLAIAPNGDVGPCSRMLGLEDEAGKHIIGNVNTGIDTGLLDLFHNPRGHEGEQCRECSRKCSGGCYAVNYEQTGDHFTPSEENCLFWTVCQEAKRISGLMRLGL